MEFYNTANLLGIIVLKNEVFAFYPEKLQNMLLNLGICWLF